MCTFGYLEGNWKQYLYVSLGLILFFWCWRVSASTDKIQNEISMVQQILQHGQSPDYFEKQQANNILIQLKEITKEKFKNGDRSARVDLILLVQGLLQDDLNSLRSFLTTSTRSILVEQFKQQINENYAQKLAFAMEENQGQKNADFIVVLDKQHSDCLAYINGRPMRTMEFNGPRGIDYYVGIYCKNNEYSVQKVSADFAQTYVPVKANFYAHQQNDHQPNNKESFSPHKTPSLSLDWGENHLAFKLGLGIDYLFQFSNDVPFYQFFSSNSSWTYSTFLVENKVFGLGFDGSYVKRNIDHVALQKNINDEGFLVQKTKRWQNSENYYFFRPFLNVFIYEFQEKLKVEISPACQILFNHNSLLWFPEIDLLSRISFINWFYLQAKLGLVYTNPSLRPLLGFKIIWPGKG